MLEHGGDLLIVSERFRRPLESWLDLSTGINPCGYPVPALPDSLFRRLPDTVHRDLLLSARQYFGVESVVAAAGSQTIIQVLPQLLQPRRIAVPDCGYAEHAASWRRAGCTLVHYDGFHPLQLNLLIETGEVDSAVVINPNNPSGVMLSRHQMATWARTLSKRGGYLIVDEAFIDATAGASVVDDVALTKGVVVLRSLGKFWGLAGLRVGFALCAPELAACLHERLGPWPVSGPSAYIATRALADTVWQRQARVALNAQSRAMQSLWRELCGHFSQSITPLFLTLTGEPAAITACWETLAEQGILLRRWRDQPQLLRCGWPGNPGDKDWMRLVTALLRYASHSNSVRSVG